MHLLAKCILHTYCQMDALTWAGEVSFLIGSVHRSCMGNTDLLSILPLGGETPTVHLPSLYFSCYDCLPLKVLFLLGSCGWWLALFAMMQATYWFHCMRKIPRITSAPLSGNRINQGCGAVCSTQKAHFFLLPTWQTLVWSLSMDQMGLKINYLFGGSMTYIGHVRWFQILR